MQIQVGVVLLVEVNIAFSIEFHLHFARVNIAASVAFENWRVFEDVEHSGRRDVSVIPFDPANLARGQFCPVPKGVRWRFKQAQG